MASNWKTVAESSFPWERDALDFVRDRFPSHEPYRAWSNFEFIADDGTINEVDLLVFSPQGFFLIEIKSRPGRLFGDAGTWTWETDGKLITTDNPCFLADLKAKKLKPLLLRQKACKKKGPVPFIDALVFCSAPDLRFELRDRAAHHVLLRDTDTRPGIMAAIKRRECPGLPSHPHDRYDRPTARMISQAMEQAGIRPSQRHRKVSDYTLDQIIGEGPGYQDWSATHVQLPEAKRRVRIYNVRMGATDEERDTIQRAAQREAQLLETLQHPGILRREGFTGHELGPALVFEHDPLSVRLDHYLAQRKDQLGVDVRLDLMRQIAEVIRFANDKKVVHRGLCPQSVLISEADGGNPRIKVFNWQVGYRAGGTHVGRISRSVPASAGNSSPGTDLEIRPTSSLSRISGTSHVDRLVEDASTAYMAPEAVSDEGIVGEHLDVFSLGAIAYHLFSGEAPADNGLELSNKLRETKGLQISSVLNGAGENLQFLVQYSTHPEVANRIDSVVDFLGLLDDVEEELTTPEHDFVEDPSRAQKGDSLPENFTVIKRLGQGACSVALLVQRDGQDYILKVASDTEHNPRLKDESEVLQKLRHQHIVEYCGDLEMGDRMAFLMRPVLVKVRDEMQVETLGQRLRKEGRLHIDLLQRFGDDLLDVVKYLEEQGIPHRDIKPDNIAVGQVGRGDKLHLVLFDFSLARTPGDNIRAGTTGYLDPLLPLRKPPRWDLHAERYAAAITLYELATGTLPKWGDGNTDPSHLDCEITIDAELFDASLRDAFTDFFQQAFRRDPTERFDNAEEMLVSWRDCFAEIELPGTLSDHEDEEVLRELLADATFDTQIVELGLGTRAANALDRANVLTVEDLLTVSLRRLRRLRGVGNKTRREIAMAVKILRERLGQPVEVGRISRSVPETAFHLDGPGDPSYEDQTNVATLSVDLIAQRLTKPSSRERDTARRTLLALLGLDPQLDDLWPSQTDVAACVDVTRGRIAQLVSKFQGRWAKEPAITQLRSDLADILERAGAVMSVLELSEAILVARGSVQDEPKRSKLATAVARACVEVERTMAEPRFLVRRVEKGSGTFSAKHPPGRSGKRYLTPFPRILVAMNQGLASYASCLGDEADKLANEELLVPPVRVIQRLRDVPLPTGAAVLSDARLVRLAAAASQHAAVSSRQELYPRGMEAARALKLSQGALYGVQYLTVQQIRDRVSSRYPEACELPGRPALDDLLIATGLDLVWDPEAKGAGAYAPKQAGISSLSIDVTRLTTAKGVTEGEEITPDIADARQFEERLQRGIKDGSFLALMVNPKYYDRACRELCDRFPVKLVDFEGLFIDALRDVVDKAGAKWEAVVDTDAIPGEGNWDKFMVLVKRAMPQIEEFLDCGSWFLAEDGKAANSHDAENKQPRTKNQEPENILLTYVGMLARYDQMALLDRLRERVERGESLRSCWILLPGDQQAMIEGRTVPIIGPGQRARIPESWLRNVHRGSV